MLQDRLTTSSFAVLLEEAEAAVIPVSEESAIAQKSKSLAIEAHLGNCPHHIRSSGYYLIDCLLPALEIHFFFIHDLLQCSFRLICSSREAE